MSDFKLSCAAAALAMGAGTSAWAGVVELDLSGYEHGRVLNGVTLAGGITLSADNFHGSEDLLVVFDTTQRRTDDRDLEGPNSSGGGWDRGNLRYSSDPLGNVLIVQEKGSRSRGFTDSTNTVVSRPDDEGRRSGGSRVGAGEITMDFAVPVSSVGFTLIDVEEISSFNNRTAFYASFTGAGETTRVDFKDFIDSGSTFYDSTVAFGDNSANQVQPLTATGLGLTGIDSVTFNFGGSAAVGEIVYSPGIAVVPTPSAGALFLTGIIAIGSRRRRYLR